MQFIKNLYKDKEQWIIPSIAPLFVFLDWLLGNPLDYHQRLKETEEKLKKKYPNYKQFI